MRREGHWGSVAVRKMLSLQLLLLLVVVREEGAGGRDERTGKKERKGEG